MTPTTHADRAAVAVFVGLYIGAAAAANLAVAWFGPAATFPVALVCIGFDLTARDWLHDVWAGRGLAWRMGLLIAAGSALSALLSPSSGSVAGASCAAFAISGAADALVYGTATWLPHRQRVIASNLVSAAVDSLVFPMLAFGAWLPWAVLGQFVAKALGGTVWAVLLTRRKRR